MMVHYTSLFSLSLFLSLLYLPYFTCRPQNTNTEDIICSPSPPSSSVADETTGATPNTFEIFCSLMKEYKILEEWVDADDAAANPATTTNGPVLTIFAPTDAAFTTWEEDTSQQIEGFLSTEEALRSILLYHIVAADQVVTYDELTCSALLETVNGGSSRTKCAGDQGELKYQSGPGNTAIMDTDTNHQLPLIIEQESNVLSCNSNAIVHVVDGVILPSLNKFVVPVSLSASSDEEEADEDASEEIVVESEEDEGVLVVTTKQPTQKPSKQPTNGISEEEVSKSSDEELLDEEEEKKEEQEEEEEEEEIQKPSLRPTFPPTVS